MADQYTEHTCLSVRACSMSRSSAGDTSSILDEPNGQLDPTSDREVGHCETEEFLSTPKSDSRSDKRKALGRNARTTSVDFVPETFTRPASPPQTVTVTIVPNEQGSTVSSSPHQMHVSSAFSPVTPPTQSPSVSDNSPLTVQLENYVEDSLRNTPTVDCEDLLEKQNEYASTSPTRWELPISHLEVDQHAHVEHENDVPSESIRHSLANGTGDHVSSSQHSMRSVSYSFRCSPIEEANSSPKYDKLKSHEQTLLSHTPAKHTESQAPIDDLLQVNVPLSFASMALNIHDSSQLSNQGDLPSEVPLNCSTVEDVPFQSFTEPITDSSYILSPNSADDTRQSLTLTTSTENNESIHTIEKPTTDLFGEATETKKIAVPEPSCLSSTESSSIPPSRATLGSIDSAFKRVSAAPECRETTQATDPPSPAVTGLPVLPLPEEIITSPSNATLESVHAQGLTTTGCAPGDSLLDYAITLPAHLKTPDMLPNLDRRSPAQVVAATGGAPVDIIRKLQCGDGDGREKIDREQTNDRQSSERQPLDNGYRRVSSSTSDSRSQTSSTSLPPVINIHVRVNANLTPTSPDIVAASSEVIFGNFLTESYRMEVAASARASIGNVLGGATASASASAHGSHTMEPSTSESRVIPVEPDLFGLELASIPQSEPGSMEAVVAHNLALIGDEINRTYGSRLDNMIKILPADECPLEIFSNVARVLFSRGPTNWGQVVALFCFGYRLVMRRVRSGLVNAFFQVCKCLISFCRQMNVFAWIAAQGGWRIVQYLTCGRSSDSTSDDLHSSDDGPLSRFLMDPNSVLPMNWLGPPLPQPSVWFVGLFALCSILFVYQRLRH